MVERTPRADAVFEGGGVKGIAFAGAIAAAERDAGVKEWVNVAGTSAGSIVAALLVAGYDAAGLQKLLAEAKYARFADTGAGGKWIGGLGNAVFRLRGMAPGRYFLKWMGEQLAASPLAKELGKSELTFGDVKRRDDAFAYVAAWEFAGEGKQPILNKEPLVYEEVHMSTRSYK